MGRQVPGTQGLMGNFVSQISPVPLPLGGKKSCQQSWLENKANQAWISGESNNPRAAQGMKPHGCQAVAAEGTCAAEPASGELTRCSPSPNPNPTPPQISWHHHGEAALVSFLCQRTQIHAQSSLQAAGGGAELCQEFAPFSTQGATVIPCHARWAEGNASHALTGSSFIPH